jgi:hypothetical protein
MPFTITPTINGVWNSCKAIAGLSSRPSKNFAENPTAPGSRLRDDLFPGCRIFRVEHHYLVYRFQDDVIEVGRILHERMSFDTQIKPDDFP